MKLTHGVISRRGSLPGRRHARGVAQPCAGPDVKIGMVLPGDGACSRFRQISLTGVSSRWIA